ncbi:MAG TPA: hypothetical protein VK177_10595 [Flavobacteriales bacterium]|nr:hypothetical protein [Flavobacteriales bacterium]
MTKVMSFIDDPQRFLISLGLLLAYKHLKPYTMSPLENLHYALGQLAYAVACADGVVQKEERHRFQDLVAAELRCKEYGFEIADIIFKIRDKDKTNDVKTTYDIAMKEIRLNSDYLSPELKRTFIRTMEKVARAYLPITHEEWSIIEKFKTEIESVHGDPNIYEKRPRKTHS